LWTESLKLQVNVALQVRWTHHKPVDLQALREGRASGEEKGERSDVALLAPPYA